MKTDDPQPQVEYLLDREVTAAQDVELRGLISSCFQNDACFVTQRFFHEMPAHRWIIRDENGAMIAHTASHDKIVGTEAGDIAVAGIAEVCVAAAHRKRGLVKRMLAALEAWHRTRPVAFGFLFGDPAVYRSSGYVSITNDLRAWNFVAKQWTIGPNSGAMVKSFHGAKWPPGLIDLRGPTF